MSSLDNPNIYSKKPYRDAFEILSNYVKDFLDGLEIGEKVEVGEVESIAFLGVGGSGIIGDSVSQILNTMSDVRTVVVKDYIPPNGEWDLTVAVSYSGNTAETLEALSSLVRDEAKVLVVTSDGKLAQLAEKIGAYILRVKSGMPPRYAFPNMLGAVLGALRKVGIDLDELKAGAEAADLFREKISENIPLDRNPAKSAAEKIFGKIPIVYAYREVSCIGYRLKCELNENAKLFCHYGDIPEAFHNDVEGYPENFLLVFPRSFQEPEPIKHAIEALCEIVGYDKCLSLKVSARRSFEELLKLFMFMDYISVYTSILTGSNPMTLDRIPAMKKRNKAYSEILSKVSKRFGI